MTEVTRYNQPVVFHKVDRLFKVENPATLAPSCDNLHKIVYNVFDSSALYKVISNCDTQLDKKLSPLAVAPIHLAAIAGNKEAVRILKDAGADMNAKDHKKSTAAHLAGMKADKAMATYLTSLGTKASEDKLGATFHDYLTLTRYYSKEQWAQELRTLDIERMTQFAEVSEYTENKPAVDLSCIPAGTVVVKENVGSPQFFADRWETTAKEKEFKERIRQANGEEVGYSFLPDNVRKILGWTESDYRAFKRSPTQVYVAPVTKDDKGNKLPAAVGCGLYAGADIAAGQIIDEYTGELWEKDTEKQPPSGHYEFTLGDIDGANFRSPSIWSNDGFPNAQTQAIPAMDGLENRELMVATKPIKKGEQILWNYGASYELKIDTRSEMAPKAMFEFFKKNSWTKILSAHSSMPEMTKKSLLEILDVNGKTAYVLDTPDAMVTLLENKLISTDDIRKILTNQDLLKLPGIIGTMMAFYQAANVVEQVRKHDTKLAKAILEDLRASIPALKNENLLQVRTKFILTTTEAFRDLTMKDGKTLNFSNKAHRNELRDILKDRLKPTPGAAADSDLLTMKPLPLYKEITGISLMDMLG